MSVVNQIRNVTLGEEQFLLLIAALDQTDWWNIAAQCIAVAVAAFSGFWFQKRFRALDEIKIRRGEIHKFNEAVVYLAAVSEEVVALVDGLVLPCYLQEKDRIKELMNTHESVLLSNKGAEIHVNRRFVSIKEIDLLESKFFIEKIADIGRHAKTMQLFFRLKVEVKQLADIAEDRMFLIKKIYNSSDHIEVEKLSKEQILLSIENDIVAYKTVFDRTAKMMYSLRTSFKHIDDLAVEMGEIARALNVEVEEKSMKNIKASRLEHNAYHKDLIEKLDLAISEDDNLNQI